MRDASRLEKLSVRSDPARMREVRAWVAAIAEGAGLGGDDVRDLAVVMSEICSNVHRHAYDGRTDGRMDLEAEAGEGRIRVTVRDYGRAFDLASYRAPCLREAAEGGYGVYLIRRLTDHAEFTNMDVGTRIVLVKSRRPRGE